MKAVKLPSFLASIVAIGMLGTAAQPAKAVDGLSRGHNLLLKNGLQIQALTFPAFNVSGTGAFNATRWAESHFTTYHVWNRLYVWNSPPDPSFMPAPPGIPWSITDYREYPTDIDSAGFPYASKLVSYQFSDEQDVGNAANLASLTAGMASLRVTRPDVILYTNQWGTQSSNSVLRNYMSQAKPDMLCFDTYPFNGSLTGGSPRAFYTDMQKYRNLGLAGNDGTGTTPIPTALCTQTFTGEHVSNHVVSESEIRLNNFSAWAFGYKFVDSFVYERPEQDAAIFPVLFTGDGTGNPTEQFGLVAETNLQSRNLGPALVRLISTDVRMIMGLHGSGSTNSRPSGVSAWSSSAHPYITGIDVQNYGTKNNRLPGDLIVGYFKPLHASLTNPGHDDDEYFMIVNGLSDANGYACECLQQIHFTFDFGDSGIDSLLRLNRHTGLVETVNLIPQGGSTYSWDLYLDGGTGDLFKFDNGGTFVIPEPGTICLLGIGLISLLCYAGWRRPAALLLAGMILSGFGVGRVSAADGDRKLLNSERSVLATNAAWGSINSLADGSLAVVYQKAREVSQTHGGFNVSMEWIRSTDGGLSWSQPVTLAEKLGSGGRLYDTRPDSGYLVYERRNQAFGQMPNGRIVCSMANLDYYFDSTGKAEVQNHLGSGFRYNGMSLTYSDDLGQTWAPLQPLSPGPFGGQHVYNPYIAASPHGEIVTLSDGTSLMSVYGSRDPAYTGPFPIPAGTTYMAGVFRSTDNGQTWGDPSMILTKSDGLPYEETSLCVLPGDKLLAEQRTPAGDTVQYVSTDKGRTWQGPTSLTEAGQHPSDAIRLHDGTLLATWGNRREPYGAMGMLSLDEGKTWEYDNRVHLAWDEFYTASDGYANAAQAGDGSIVVISYAGGWSGNIHAVRFTEEAFLQAAGLQVPEPSALTLAAIGLLCLSRFARRNRSQQQFNERDLLDTL